MSESGRKTATTNSRVNFRKAKRNKLEKYYGPNRRDRNCLGLRRTTSTVAENCFRDLDFHPKLRGSNWKYKNFVMTNGVHSDAPTHDVIDRELLLHIGRTCASDGNNNHRMVLCMLCVSSSLSNF